LKKTAAKSQISRGASQLMLEADFDKISKAYNRGNPCPFIKKTSFTCRKDPHRCTQLCLTPKTFLQCPTIYGIIKASKSTNPKIFRQAQQNLETYTT
jgi:hypothetical protein